MQTSQTTSDCNKQSASTGSHRTLPHIAAIAVGYIISFAAALNTHMIMQTCRKLKLFFITF